MIETSKYHVGSAQLTKEHEYIVAAKKNPKDFAVLYDMYYEAIFRFIYKRMDDKEMTFDTTQQVFLKALDNIQKYEFKGVPFASWLYRIAYNEINTMFRTQKAEHTINIDSVSIYNIIEEIQETKIEFYHDKIVNIIAEELEEEEIQLIEMRFFEKRSFKEIAEILEITENNAKVKTYRIIDKLKKILK